MADGKKEGELQYARGSSAADSITDAEGNVRSFQLLTSFPCVFCGSVVRLVIMDDTGSNAVLHQNVNCRQFREMSAKEFGEATITVMRGRKLTQEGGSN